MVFFSNRWNMLGMQICVVFAVFRSYWYSGNFWKLLKKNEKQKIWNVIFVNRILFFEKKNKTFCSRENFFPILRKKNCSVDQNVWTVSKKQKNTNSYMLGNFRKTQKQNLIKTCRRAKKTARPFIICIEGLRIANYFWERKNMFWVKKQRKQSKYSDFVTRQKMSFWGGCFG